MSKTRVLVLGADGLLGSSIYREFVNDSSISVIGTSRSCAKTLAHMTAKRKSTEAVISEFYPDVIINCIGLNPHKSNETKNIFFQYIYLNSFYPRLLARIADKKSIRVIHFSTNGVFNRLQTKCSEVTRALPLTYYGLTKLAGESKISNVVNIRCSFIGRGEVSRENPYLLDWFEQTPPNCSISGFTDQIWNGVTTIALARLTRVLVNGQDPFPKLLHISSADSISKFELLGLLKNNLGRESITIVPIKSNRRSVIELTTIHPGVVHNLWKSAGYNGIPSIKDLICEL